MTKIPEGCILLARKIKNSDIWVSKPAWWLKVWSYILMEVNHKDNKYFKRGENMFSRKQIHADCHLSLDRIGVETVDNLLRWLRATTQITTRKTTRGIVINVSKYGFFQDLINYKNDTENDNMNDTQNETETRQKRDRNDTINNNVKNDKNDKNKEKDTGTPVEQTPLNPKPYAVSTPLQRVVVIYKIAKGFKFDDKDWDTLNWPRATKSAERLLKYFHGSVEKCLDCIDELSEKFKKKGWSDWQFEDVVSRAADWSLEIEKKIKSKAEAPHGRP